MKIRIVTTALAITIVAALTPAAASAQSFGVYVGQSYPAYDYGRPGYGYDGGPAYYQRGYDEDRRERWEQRARWEREEARRRYWQQERREHRGDWHHGDDDDER